MSDAARAVLLFVAALIPGFAGTGVTILWPNKRWIGWVCIGFSLLLLFSLAIWAVFQFRHNQIVSSVGFGLIVVVIVTAILLTVAYEASAIAWAWPFDSRVNRVRRLLREAAIKVRSQPLDRKQPLEELLRRAHLSWMIVFNFLNAAFTEPQGKLYGDFLEAERAKVGRERFDLSRAAADYLDRLANRTRSKDVDAGFLIPDSFEQYDPYNWPANRR